MDRPANSLGIGCIPSSPVISSQPLIRVFWTLRNMQSGYSRRKISSFKIFKLFEFMDEWLIYYLKHKINPRLLPPGSRF